MGSDDFARRLFMLEEAVRKLSTAERANKTDVRNGAITLSAVDGMPSVELFGNDTEAGLAVVDDDGDSIGYLGTSTNSTLLSLANDDKSAYALRVRAGELRFPIITAAFQKDPYASIDSLGRPVTSSGSYVTLWRTVISVGGASLYGVVDVIPPGGTTASARIVLTNFFDPVADFVLGEATGITTTSLLTDTWPVPTGIRGVPGDSSVGATVNVFIQARITAGAGPVAIAPRYPIVGLANPA